MNKTNTIFGQLVIGPPGSGKTTYCHGMQQFLQNLGRKVAVINVDPGNDILPYECSLNISELITIEDVMDHLNLGPNSAFVYCMEFLEENLEWFREKLSPFSDCYLLIDCPGQSELYTHHNSVKNIVETMNFKWDVRLCAVHLVDSHYCCDPGTFVSVLLKSLNAMLQVELPYVHVLSKIDLVEKQKKLDFNLDFYTDVLDLNYLLDNLSDDPFLKKFKKLSKTIVEVVENYSLVSFIPLNIEDKECTLQVMKAVDQANGYIYGSGEEINIQTLLSSAVGVDCDYFKAANIQEKYVDNSQKMDDILHHQ